MSSKDDFAKKISKSLDQIAARQEEICARIERLEQRVGANTTPHTEPGDRVIGFLDFFRAGEELGEASIGAWIEVCDHAGLRGSLRVIQMREGFHARLLEARIKELGGSPKAAIPEDRFNEAMERSGDSKTSDVTKLAAFLKPFADIDAAIAPILEMANQLDDDLETQFLLRTIAQDERATLECLVGHCEVLSA